VTTEERIRNFIEKELRYEGLSEGLTDETSLLEGGVIDSLGIVKLVSFLESEFGIKVPDEEIVPRYFESIRALSTYVESKPTS
jgi:acyl carrier protein